MKRTLLPSLLLLLAGLSPAVAADLPTFTVVDTGLDAVLGDAGKGVLDPHVSGFTGIAYGQGIFVAVAASVGESVIRWATSPDGLTWTAHSQATPAGSTSLQTSKVHFLNGKFLFFTGFGDSGSGSTWAYSSADGLAWTANKVANGRANVEEFDASPTLTVAAAHNGAQFASADLVTWTARPVIPNGAGYDHLDLAYGAGRFFSSINGFGGVTYASTDAVTWTALPATSTIGGSRVEAGNGFLVFTVSSDQYKSTDGVTLTKLTPTVPAGWFPPGGSPRYTSGGFVATGIHLGTATSAYLVSSDAQTWSALGVAPAPSAVPAGQSHSYLDADIAYGAGRFVIAGTNVTQSLFTKTTLPLILVLDAAAAPTAPTITTQPAAQNAVAGGTATFTVAASGTGLSYQWKFNGTAISGATAATLTLTDVQPAQAGSYSVDVTAAGLTTTSAAATLTLVTASDAGRIVNISVRSYTDDGDNSLIAGFVLGGDGTTGTTSILLRGVGPTLADYGLPAAGLLANPSVALVANGTTLARNDDWAGDPTVAAAANLLGASALSGPNSKDAALVAHDLAAGPYTMVISGGSGLALAEVYHAPGTYTATTRRLLNVSGRAFIGTGDDVLIAGFVIGGTTSKTLLIRGVGPALVGYGLPTALADSRVELFRAGNSTALFANDNWGDSPDANAIKATAAAVGAFPLAAGSKDAALLVTLPPGVYSAVVSGVGAATGVGLVEVYDVQ